MIKHHSRWVWLALCTVILAPSGRPARGQAPAAVEPPKFADLSDAQEWVRKRVMIIGKSSGGVTSFGTAFVISRKNRLVATNSHVADSLDPKDPTARAVIADTSQDFRVEKVWFHPNVLRRGVNRVEPGRLFLVNSMDPKDGSIFFRCPDVAVVRLAEGPELPEEVTMASWDELKRLVGKSVGSVGFPLYRDNPMAMPERGAVADKAQFSQGIVTRVSDFIESSKQAILPEATQFIEHTVGGLGGSSGSPIFLTNGHVVGLHNSGTVENDRGQSQNRHFGVRIDCLWELLVYHKLDDQVSIPADKSKIRTDRNLDIDPEVRTSLRAWGHANHAFRLHSLKKYDESIAECDKALEINKGCTDALEIRCEARLWRFHEQWSKLSEQEKKSELKAALEDATKAAESGFYGKYLVAVILNNIGFVSKDQIHFENSLKITKALLAENAVKSNEKIASLVLASQATSMFKLGDKQGALVAFSSAVRLWPADPSLHADFGNFLRMTGDPDRARKEFEIAEKLRLSQGGQD